MDGGIRQESVNASFNTETTRVPTWTSEPLTIPKTVNSFSNFSPIQNNSISLSEDRSALSQPCDNVCGDELFDSCDLSSPISLKRDPSFPCQLNMADVDDGLKISSGKYCSTSSCWLQLIYSSKFISDSLVLMWSCKIALN